MLREGSPARQLRSLSARLPEASRAPGPALPHMRQVYCRGTAVIPPSNCSRGPLRLAALSDTSRPFWLRASGGVQLRGGGRMAVGLGQPLVGVWSVTARGDSPFQLQHQHVQNGLQGGLYKLAELSGKFITLICLQGQVQGSRAAAEFGWQCVLRTLEPAAGTAAGSRDVLLGSRVAYSAVQISSASPLDVTVHQ